MSEVVLNGTGGSTLRRVFFVSTTVPVVAPATASSDGLRRVLGLEPVGRVRRGERLAAAGERALHDPVVLGDERVALRLAVDDELERRRLDPAGGEDVTERPPRLGLVRECQVARQGGAPDQVDVLPRLARLREALGDLVRARRTRARSRPW